MDENEVQGHSYTDDDLIKLKAIFDEIDEDKTGYITSDRMRTCAQMLGQNPTSSEVEIALESVETTSSDRLTFEECRRVAEAISKPMEIIEDDIGKSLSKIIQSLDSSEGDMFRKEELKSFLQERGDEPLLGELIDGIFNDIDPDSDRFSTSQLIQLLTTDF